MREGARDGGLPTAGGGMSRRQLLATAGVVALSGAVAACSSGGTTSPRRRVLPNDPVVAATERTRLEAGGGTLRSFALTAEPGTIDLGGVMVPTWTYGAAVPGREIRVRQGERLRVDVSNALPDPTSVHWHGLAIRNDMDGVAGLTQQPVVAGKSQRYEFVVPDAGTYWFHPHVGTQLDRGLYAPLIVEDPADGAAYDDEWVLVVDDWIDGTGSPATTPDTVLAGLRRDGMSAMGGMDGTAPASASEPLGSDTGDVVYPYYLINGRLPIAADSRTVRAGQRIRLRLINAGGDTAFRIGIPGVPMTITHTDGFAVEPTSKEAILLGMGERVDAIITVPPSTTPILAIAEGKTGSAQAVLKVAGSSLGDTGGALAKLAASVPFDSARAAAVTAVRLSQKAPDVRHELVLGGPDGQYNWTINGRGYDPARGLPVVQGQRVRLTFTNQTGMFHPMHLHGHTFQVRPTDGGAGPRKDTVLVLPGASVDVDFDADNPGQWLTHCHNIYHGEAGMMTVVSYMST